MTLDYTSYLELDGLLDLQHPLSEEPAHDEMLFIVIHQTYELWFKEVIHELGHLQASLEAGEAAAARMTLKRLRRIFRLLVDQWDVLETLTPAGFASFRDALETASGFQSAQFREVEMALGKRDARVLEYHAEGSEAHQRLRLRLGAPSVYTSFLRFLAGQGHAIPKEAVERTITESCPAIPEVQPTLAAARRGSTEVAELCEGLLDLDQSLQAWRYRHVKVVERIIGQGHGTGGSTGAEYLKATLFAPLFPDLWELGGQL